MLTQSALKEVLHYAPDTGEFTWLKSVNGRAVAGQRAGLLAPHRSRISVLGKRYYAYHLAWLYVYGHLPPGEVDHVNRDPHDNRISNLRLADRSTNTFNRRPYCEDIPNGVGWFAQTQRWRARIKVAGKEHALGYFVDLSDAVSARKAAERQYFKHFPRHEAGG